MYLLFDANQGRFARFNDSDTDLQWAVVEQEASLASLIAPDIDSVKGVVVWQGKGSFSQSREAVVVANMLALTKGVKLLSMQADELPPLKALINELEASDKTALEPVYYAEPNINSGAMQ